jgi:hypothetical protein
MVSQEKEGIYAYQGGGDVIEGEKPEPETENPRSDKQGVPHAEGYKAANDKGKNAIFVEIVMHPVEDFRREYPGDAFVLYRSLTNPYSYPVRDKIADYDSNVNRTQTGAQEGRILMTEKGAGYDDKVLGNGYVKTRQKQTD